MAMSEAELENIENRWLEASSGPWHVIDYRDGETDGVFIPHPGAFEKMQREGGKLEGLKASTFEEALEIGIVKTKEQWADLLEKIYLQEPEIFDTIANHCQLIACMTRAAYDAQSRQTDKAFMKGKNVPSPEEQPHPSFAVLPGTDCKPADLTFVLKAPSDIGALLTEVRRLREQNESMKADLIDLRQQAKEAQESMNTMKSSSAKLREVAEQLLKELDA